MMREKEGAVESVVVTLMAWMQQFPSRHHSRRRIHLFEPPETNQAETNTSPASAKNKLRHLPTYFLSCLVFPATPAFATRSSHHSKSCSQLVNLESSPFLYSLWGPKQAGTETSRLDGRQG